MLVPFLWVNVHAITVGSCLGVEGKVLAWSLVWAYLLAIWGILGKSCLIELVNDYRIVIRCQKPFYGFSMYYFIQSSQQPLGNNQRKPKERLRHHLHFTPGETETMWVTSTRFNG